MSLPDYVTEAIHELEDFRDGFILCDDYDGSQLAVAQELLNSARATLAAVIERYAQESVAADYRKRWQESYGKLIEDQPDTLPPFINNPPPIG